MWSCPLARLPAGVVAVTKSPDPFIDIQANTLLPNREQAEKWEGLAIGPRLVGGDRLILAGNDNDYSVTQTGAGEQFDVYVDFNGNVVRCVLDDPTQCAAESGGGRHRDRQPGAAPGWVPTAARRAPRVPCVNEPTSPITSSPGRFTRTSSHTV